MEIINRYSSEGYWVEPGEEILKNKRFIAANLVSPQLYQQNPADALKRTLIRHDPDKLAKTIISLL